ncbi:MAG: hypothetical protein LBM17_02875 [Candidatus Accumulibacter sp.]|jgi:hypothetical protein|nr:hypothetical protein [Accumulibacter sp.]
MPFLLEHIDAIARKLGRDVLFVDFPACHHDIFMRSERVDYEKYKPRKTIIRWLDKNGIGWRPCAGFADENSMPSYAGEIHIDVPFDENDPTYKMVDGFLAHDDMTPKIEGSIFFYLPLEVAMKNKHHDEPGFWDKWAENW